MALNIHSPRVDLTTAYIIRIEGQYQLSWWWVLNHNRSNNIHIFIHPTTQNGCTTNHTNIFPFYLISLFSSSIYISCSNYLCQTVSFRSQIAKVTASSFIRGGGLDIIYIYIYIYIYKSIVIAF